jgi:hypothetical protein
MAGPNILFAVIRRHPARVQAVLALLCLLVGILVYVLDRNPQSTYFLPEAFSYSNGEGSVFGPLGNQLPDFLHLYAFILLSCALLQPRRPAILGITLVWLLIEVGFELGQHPAASTHIANAIPSWFSHIPLLENTAAYFTHGHFDPLDLVAMLLAAIAGYLTVRLMPAYAEDSASG